MYKVIAKDYPDEIYASGIYSKEKGQQRIDSGYYHRHLIPELKERVLILVKE